MLGEEKIMGNDYLEKPKYLMSLDGSPANDDFSVLTDRETIQNIARHICYKLCHPVTILDINRLKKSQNPDPRTDIRIDSDIDFFSMRYACKLFRCYAGTEKCYECENFHAAMLQGTMQNTTKKELEKKIERDSEIYPSFFAPSYGIRKPVVKNIKYYYKNQESHRLIIEYHCPMLGYRELLIPIFFGKKVIGVFILMQMVIRGKNDKETINTIKEEFFSKTENNPENIFMSYLYGQNKKLNKPQIIKKANELKKRIIKADGFTERMERYLNKPKETSMDTFPNMTFNSYEDYEKFIFGACCELSVLENTLLNEAKIKQKRYFDKIVQYCVNSYFLSQTNTDALNNVTYNQQREDMENAWKHFFEVKEKIKEYFNLEDVILFGDGGRLNVINTNKKKVFYKDKEDKSYASEFEYDFSILIDKQPLSNEPLISLNDHSILDGLCAVIDRTKIILLVYPEVAILLKVKNLAKNKYLYTEMAKCIGKGFSRICSDISLRSANFMKNRYMLTLRMYRHESAHISTRLNDNLKTYFIPNATKFIHLDDEKQGRITKDMQDTINLISHMSNNIGFITGSINADTIRGKERKLDVLNLLYKWQIMFRSQLKGRNLDIQINRYNKYDVLRYIKTNAELFELLLYNLVDNAVKYAYRGSVIQLTWHRSSVYADYYELNILSYGPQIEEEDKHYELYTRGNNERVINELNSVEGDGIGLYVVKQICKLIGLGGVCHKCEYISPYNIPLIPWFLNEPFNDTVHKKKRDELNLFLNSVPPQKMEEVKMIINSNSGTQITRQALSEEYLISRIDRKTWLTTFTVKVPVTMKCSIEN